MHDVVSVRLCLTVLKCCLGKSSRVLLEILCRVLRSARGKEPLSFEEVLESKSSSGSAGSSCLGCVFIALVDCMVSVDECPHMVLLTVVSKAPLMWQSFCEDCIR